jgi:hypothetical protein
MFEMSKSGMELNSHLFICDMLMLGLVANTAVMIYLLSLSWGIIRRPSINGELIGICGTQ